MQRKIEKERWDAAFLEKVRGSPWNPQGLGALATAGAPLLERGAAVLSGSLLRGRKLYVTKEMVNEHGATQGCARCAVLKRGKATPGIAHNDECRKRFEWIQKLYEESLEKDASAAAASSNTVTQNGG